MFPLSTDSKVTYLRNNSWLARLQHLTRTILGSSEKSVDYWLQLLRKESGKPQLHLVRRLMDYELYQEARDYLESVIGLDTAQDAEIHYLRARCYMHQGLVREAYDVIQSALEKEPQNAIYLELQADLLLEQGNWQAATDVLNKAVRANPKNAEMIFRLGAIYAHHGEHLEALRCFQGCCELKPNRAVYWEMKAESHLQLNQMAQAAAGFARSLRYRMNPDIIARLAYCYIQMNDMKKGVQYYKKVLKYEPDHYDSLCNLAAVFQNMGRSLEALNLQEKAYNLCKTDPILLNNMAYTLVQLGRTRKATEYYQEALKLAQGHPLILYNLAVCHVQKGNWQAGMEVLDRLLKMKPDHSEGWALLGNIYEQLMEYDRAIDCFNRALKLA